MNDIAYIFPGQGAQYVGMGRELYEASPIAKNIIDKASEILGIDVKKFLFQGPETELKSTINCQPAILIHSIAALEALNAATCRDAKSCVSTNIPKFTAGLSVGEYSALVASGVLSFEDALILLRKRAKLMDEAAEKYPGKMAAIIGFDKDKLKSICAQSGCQIANINCPGQIVISGRIEAVDSAKEAARQEAKTVVDLEVSGAFHSLLMNEAAEKFEKELEKVKLNPASIPVISNLTAAPQTEPEEIRKNLKRQLNFPVLWEDSIRYIVSQGVNTFFEIGPNKILKGILRRIDPALKVYNIEKPQDIDNLPLMSR